MPRMRALVLLFVALSVHGGEAVPSWSGEIEIVESLSGSAKTPADRAEFDRLIATLGGRLRWARLEVGTLPPAMAGVVRNDIGVMESELERAILARGGEPYPVGRTTYLIAQGRIRVESELATVVVDRNRGLAWIRAGGAVEERRLEPPPEAQTPVGLPGPELFGHPSFTTVRRIDGRDHQVTYLPGLPNPYALAALPVVGPHSGADLVSDLARIPGLPVVVITNLGTVTLMLNAVHVEGRPIPDALFAPLR
jgi:hypothetical protein